MKVYHECLSGFVFLLLIFTGCNVSYASRYYVDQQHSSSSDQNPGTSGLPWKTITKANQSLVAGDTVLIKSGTYNSYIAPVNSGTVTAPIVYKNYESDRVTISDTWYAINLDSKSYIVVEGLFFTNLYYFMYIRNGSGHNTIAYCSFDQARLTDGKTYSWSGSRIYNNSSYNRIHHCQFSKYGYYTSDDIGCVLDIGNENTKTDFTSHNLIEDCIFFHGGHHVVGIYGQYNVLRNNYFHNEPWSMGTAESDRGAVLYGDRNISVAGYVENSGRNLIEGNRIAYSSDPSDNVGASGMALNTGYNIVRFNRFYHNNRAGLSMSVTSSYAQNILFNKVYHNTFFHNGINTEDPNDHMNSGIGFGFYSGTLLIENNSIINNLLYKHRVPYGTYKVNLDAQFFAGNWNGDSQGDPVFVNAPETLGDPLDPHAPDLRIRSGSPCRDKGTFLTTITSPAGSGSSFTVSDAGFFTDGWGIPGVQGDEIQLFHSSQKARIMSLDYSTNLITVDKEITWTRDQGICLAHQGEAPDPGAFECLEYPAGLPEMNEQIQIMVFPNPTTGLIHLSLKEKPGSDYQVSLFGKTGILLQTLMRGESELITTIDISNYAPGTYFLRIVMKNNIHHIKILKL